VTEPDELIVRHCPAPAPIPEIVRLVVEAIVVERTVEVAKVRKVLPVSVVEAAKRPLVAFNSEEIVVEPVTASEVDVAPWSEVAPETVSDESVVAPAVIEPNVAPPVALN